MSNEGPITQEEMIELFGEAMPIEAVQLLWQADGSATVGQIRAKLREIGQRNKLVSRLRLQAVNYSSTCGDLFDEAADAIERYERFIDIITYESDPGRYRIGMRDDTEVTEYVLVARGRKP